MSEKLCVFCEHWDIDGGSPDYSDLTPGEDASMNCRKQHFKWHEMQLWDISPEGFRAIILKAETCQDYAQVKP